MALADSEFFLCHLVEIILWLAIHVKPYICGIMAAQVVPKVALSCFINVIDCLRFNDYLGRRAFLNSLPR